MHGGSRCKAMQGCRGKTALVWIIGPTLVRFLDLVQGESFPTQDEPERRTCFQHKMSLKD